MDSLRKGINQIKDNALNEMSDYDLFNSIYYSPSKYNRDNYVQGEEEEIWNKLNKHFDLPKYESNKYGFVVNDKDKIVQLMENGISDNKGFGGYIKAPKFMPLRRRK